MKLVLLRCPVCQEPLTPAEQDVVFSCRNCHTPIFIGRGGPRPQTTHFAYPAGGDLDAAASTVAWLPFWVCQGQIAITRRQSQGGSAASQSEAMWGPTATPLRRLLYVPAWELSVSQAQALGSQLIQSQPSLRPVERPAEARLAPAVIGSDDAKKMLEFIILAIEARRSDMLRDLAFETTLSKAQLWALPLKMFPGTAMPAGPAS